VSTERLLHRLLTASAERAPDAQAVRFQDETLSYGELDSHSNRLAGALAEEGVGLGDPVMLHLPKSPDAIVGLLGIMKAGACCVPVDAGTPAPRLRAILDQCRARVAIISADTRDTLASQPLECVVDASEARSTGDPPPVAVSEDDLAYILFTSGSTGTPKGVELSHLNVRTFVDWAVAKFSLRPEDRLSSHAPLNFDLSTFDVFGALAAGASITIVPERLSMFPSRLAELIEHERLTVWYSVPSVLTLLATHGGLERRDLGSLRLMLFAGEVFPVKYLRELMRTVPSPRYVNLYGPTETNVCTYYEVEELPQGDAPIPIGKPCEGLRVVALDAEGRPVEEPGVEGVLHVGGPGVTPGYYGRPEETEAAFVEDPAGGGRLYCTGDWVTIDGDGNYLFLGRRDHMIKSGGHRIELGEVEAALYSHPGIREAVAVAVPDELLGNRLRAVVVPVGPEALDEQEIRRHCAGRLPRYMVPAEVELRDELPRTSTQKVDRARLALESLATGGADG
jgi:amino acid adenylation domain-containing protein